MSSPAEQAKAKARGIDEASRSLDRGTTIPLVKRPRRNDPQARIERARRRLASIGLTNINIVLFESPTGGLGLRIAFDDAPAYRTYVATATRDALTKLERYVSGIISISGRTPSDAKPPSGRQDGLLKVTTETEVEFVVKRVDLDRLYPTPRREEPPPPPPPDQAAPPPDPEPSAPPPPDPPPAPPPEPPPRTAPPDQSAPDGPPLTFDHFRQWSSVLDGEVTDALSRAESTEEVPDIIRRHDRERQTIIDEMLGRLDHTSPDADYQAVLSEIAKQQSLPTSDPTDGDAAMTRLREKYRSKLLARVDAAPPQPTEQQSTALREGVATYLQLGGDQADLGDQLEPFTRAPENRGTGGTITDVSRGLSD